MNLINIVGGQPIFRYTKKAWKNTKEKFPKSVFDKSYAN